MAVFAGNVPGSGTVVQSAEERAAGAEEGGAVEMIAALKDFIEWLGADPLRLIGILVLAWALSCAGGACHVSIHINSSDAATVKK